MLFYEFRTFLLARSTGRFQNYELRGSDSKFWFIKKLFSELNNI
jgi:hypothetical protein